MHLFLIRHGETEHNVAGLLAGVTDSRLTNHGVTQTQRLGVNLVKDRGLRFTNVYSSDLQRAFMTASEICKAQNLHTNSALQIEVVKLALLREQDFGSLELVAWSSRRVEETSRARASSSSNEEFKPKETADSMRDRANTFLDDYIVPLLAFDHEEATRVAVVSHGIFLGHLWKTLFSRLRPNSVTVNPNITIASSGQSLERMSWSNTGCLEVDIKAAGPVRDEQHTHIPETSESTNSTFFNATMKIQTINDKRHLLNLKRARGGIGSAAHDQSQQNLTTFFKAKKLKMTPASTTSKPPIPSKPSTVAPVPLQTKNGVDAVEKSKTKPG